MNIANRDVTLSVVFRLDDSDGWHEWTTGHRTASEALVSAEALVKFPPVPEIRFDRVTRTTERLSLHDLAAEDAAPAAVQPAADRAALLLKRVREYLEARLDQVAVDPAEVYNLLAEAPLSPFYEHPECGFHWHGRDGMDIPMRDGQPVCPRCELRRLADEEQQPETPAVTPPPALTEIGQLRAQVEVLQQDVERDRGLAKVGARCMRVGHQGLIEQGRLVLEGWRFALSCALDLGTGAPWEAIHERVKGLAVGAQQRPDTEARPARGDQFEAWLKTQRDEHRDTGRGVWSTLDNLLDLYRLHADTGTPLDEHVCEGRAVGDCEHLEPAPVAPQPTAEAHTCRNCEGIDPASCLFNPDRPRKIVAYRFRYGRSLRCLAHQPSGPGARNYDPVTSEDLPDGGTCTYVHHGEECGVDVLIPQPAAADTEEPKP